MTNKPSYYAIIPANVRYDETLTPNAKLLYAEITALCNMNGKCIASTNYFATLYNVSRVSIQKWLKQLEDNNHIFRKVVYKEGSKQILHRYITIVNNPCIKKYTDNNNISIINNNLTDSNSRFVKPSLIEVEEYCKKRNNNVDSASFCDFYESKGWKVGRTKMRDWKASVRTWERREVNTNKVDKQLNEYIKGKELL
ncbi:MAG: hypothetical protein GOVbin2006_20 [Prokaryotic dsDNA virus sp.]|nr:MAG: hypothetical protein GOVbin2006_20 [Prokaryotic dsDNA virus sp.]|tara:strand:+ start:3616 stop:4206 length:591 start_codon:yes stop_codon:yes gene_type:complete